MVLQWLGHGFGIGLCAWFCMFLFLVFPFDWLWHIFLGAVFGETSGRAWDQLLLQVMLNILGFLKGKNRG
jgi:hypothetical protein